MGLDLASYDFVGKNVAVCSGHSTELRKLTHFVHRENTTIPFGTIPHGGPTPMLLMSLVL